jgi:hypothetical protein
MHTCSDIHVTVGGSNEAFLWVRVHLTHLFAGEGEMGVSRLRAHSSGHAYMYVPKYTYLRLP